MRAVFFDLDGTLVELPDDFAGLFEAALADCGASAGVERTEFYTEAFFEYLGECHPEPYRMAMADLREAYDLAPSAEALADAYAEREARATDLGPGVRETLDALDSSDTALGVLTNGGARAQRRKLAHHGVADHFDSVVVSGDVGAGKPDPAVFAAAKAAVPADEYVFVADDLERDVLPAQREGFTGVHLARDENADQNGEGATKGGGDVKQAGTDATQTGPDVTVSSVHAVPDLLD